MYTTYPEENYGDVVVGFNNGENLRLPRAFSPSGGFITQAQWRVMNQQMVRALGVELYKKTQEEFAPHNRTGYSVNHMEIQMGPMSVRISGPIGMYMVAGGFAAHEIHVRDARALKFGDAFANNVTNPGFEADPFDVRAVEKVNIDQPFLALTRKAMDATLVRFEEIAKSMGGTLEVGPEQDAVSEE